ncbi:MAG: hypothetical protein ACI4O7_01280 [Aristaeellaceae bacterium]
MTDRIAERIRKRYVILSLIVVLLLGIAMLSVVAPNFSARANGYPYLETKLFYTPGDLLTMVEGYGETGRALYVRISSSLDLLIPLAAANLLTSLALLLTQRAGPLKQWRKPLLGLGAGVCASDWLENLLMISLIRAWPQRPMGLAVLGRIMTSVKYLLMIVFAVTLVREARLIRRLNAPGA